MPITKEALQKYISPIFFETGSYQGETIDIALDLGFNSIHSIELSQRYHQALLDKYAEQKNVHLHHGDSGHLMNYILPRIHHRCTFWLDAHFSIPGDARGQQMSPVMSEISQIAKHHIKNHIILIDDLRLMENVYNISINSLIGQIGKINPNYCIAFENGYTEKDILVAFVPENNDHLMVDDPFSNAGSGQKTDENENKTQEQESKKRRTE